MNKPVMTALLRVQLSNDLAGELAALPAATAVGRVQGTGRIVALLQRLEGLDVTSEQAAFDKAKAFYQGTLQGQVVESVIGPVRLTGKGWRKAKFGLKEDLLKARLIEHIVEILQGGTAGQRREPYKERDDGMVAFYFIQKDVQIDQEIVTAGVTVGEDAQGNLFYNVSHAGAKGWAANENGTLDSTWIEPRFVLDAVNDSVAEDELNITILAVRPVGGRQPFATVVPDKGGAVLIQGDAEAIALRVREQFGKPQIVEGGVRLTKGDARLANFIPHEIETLASGAVLEHYASGGVAVRGDFRGGFEGIAQDLAHLESAFVYSHGPEVFAQVFGKEADPADAQAYFEEQAAIAERKADNEAREAAERIEYARSTGNWSKITDDERAQLQAERDASVAAYTQRDLENWLATVGTGRSGNPRFQAYLDTVEDLSPENRTLIQVGYMAWIPQRVAEFEPTAGRMPYRTGSPEFNAWQQAFTAHCRAWADAHLSERVKGEKAVATDTSFEVQAERLLQQYLEIQRRKFAYTMPGNERGAEVAAQYALDDMRVQLRGWREANGDEGAIAVLADDVDYSRGKVDQLLSAALPSPAPDPEPAPAPSDEPAAPAYEIIEHETGRGKILRGIVRTDLTYAEAKAIDEYTFKKNGGYFIREKHLESMGLAPAGGEPTPVPARDPEAEALREQQHEIERQQREADRLANEQERERRRVTEQVATLRKVAASSLEKANDELSRDRVTNTARRAGMAASILERAEKDRALSVTLNNLADAIEQGKATHLAGLTSKAQLVTLHDTLVGGRHRALHGLGYAQQQEQKHAPLSGKDVGYAQLPQLFMNHDYEAVQRALETGKPKGWQALSRRLKQQDRDNIELDLYAAVWKALESVGKTDAFNWYGREQLAKRQRLARMGLTTDVELRIALGEYLLFKEGVREEDPIAKAERAIIGQKVGIDFFPTPKGEATEMARLARIGKGDRVLEPSAGNGNLADAARAAGAEVDVIEISDSLRKILEAKGYNLVAYDFMEFTPEQPYYDAILMNPPFSNRRDAEHIRRAFGMLKPGGHLVAIAGEGVFIGSDAKAVAFREWLDLHGAEVEPLAQGTFQDKTLLATTGANARRIVMVR